MTRIKKNENCVIDIWDGTHRISIPNGYFNNKKEVEKFICDNIDAKYWGRSFEYRIYQGQNVIFGVVKIR